MNLIRKKEWIFLLAIVILLFAFYPRLFMFKGAWLTSDNKEQHFPWAYYFAQTLKAGGIPFWTGEIGCGFPLVAEGQIGIMYGLNLLFYGLLPIKIAYSSNIIFHLIFSGFAMYFFIRHLKLDGFSALFGSTIYLFGSTYGGAFYNLNSMKIMCWFPVVLILIDKVLERRKPLYILILILAFSQILAAGYLQYALYACIFSALYFFIRLVTSAKDRLKGFFAVALSFIASVIITLPQHLLTYELYTRSNRVGLGEAFSYLRSFSPLASICFFIPNLDVIFNGKLYMGVISVFFFILGIVILWKRRERIFIWLALVAILLALGVFSPLYVGLVKFLKFYAFRVPMKFLLFLGFFLSVIAAYGVNAIKEARVEKEVNTSFKWFTLLAVLSVSVFTVMSLILRFFYDKVYLLGKVAIENFIYNKPGHPYSLEFYTDKLVRYLDSVKGALDVANPGFWVPLVVIIISILLISSLKKKRIAAYGFLVVALLFVVVDLRTYKLDFSFQDTRDYDSYEAFFKKSAAAEFLEEDKDTYRIFNFTNNKSLLPLPANYNMIFNINSANIYSPLVMRDYYNFFGKLGGIDDSSGTLRTSREYLGNHIRQLGMLNVKYIFSDEDLNIPGLDMVYKGSDVTIYKNSFFMPRNWLVEDVKVIAERSDLFKAVNDSAFKPGEVAYLENSIDEYMGAEAGSARKDSIKLISETPEKKEFQVDCRKNSLFILSQTHYPGWRAVVDGEEARLLRVNYLISGVPLKEGSHSVTVYYKPDFSDILLKILKDKKVK